MEEAEYHSLASHTGYDEEDELEEWSSENIISQDIDHIEQETQTHSSDEDISNVSIPSTILEVPEEQEGEEEDIEQTFLVDDTSTRDLSAVEEVSTLLPEQEIHEREIDEQPPKDLPTSLPSEPRTADSVQTPILSEEETSEGEDRSKLLAESSGKVLASDVTDEILLFEEATFQQMFEETRVRARLAATGEGEKVNVNIVCSNGQRFEVIYFHYTNIAEVKDDMGKKTNINPEQLLLTLPDGRPLGDWLPLAALVTPEDPNLEIYLTFCLSLAGDDIDSHHVDLPCRPLVKERVIQITDAFGRSFEVNVFIEHINYVKEWLGGYRQKTTGKVYHHASTMTTYTKRCEPDCRQTSRVAQTSYMIDREVQLERERSAQTYTDNLFQDPASDQIIIPKPYTEYDPENDPKNIREQQAARIIQKTYRNYMSRKRAREMFIKLIDMIKYQRGKDTKKRLSEIYENLEMKRTLGTLFPKHRKDFFYLYIYIGNWWKKEYRIIKEMEDPYERMADCMLLLKREIDWLFLLETKRIKSRNAALFRRRLKILEDASRPILNKTVKRTVAIETLPIQRAKEIKEVYSQLRRRDLNRKERTEGLMKIMANALKFEDDKGMTLAKLIQREIDLLTLNIPVDYLEGIRKRIEEEILFLANDKKINPQGQYYRPVGYPRIQAKLNKCLACGKLKHVMHFSVHTRMKVLGNCLSCNWMREMNHDKINMAPYEFILICLRRKEAQRCPTTVYPFYIQPLGAFFIISVIWNKISAVSENSDLELLRMTRWDQKVEWRPWNCIVLTEEECDFHDSIENNHDIYSEEFIHQVKLKNLQVKENFIAVQDIATFGKYSGLEDRNMYVGSSMHFKSRAEGLQKINPFLKDPPFKAFTSMYKTNLSSPCRNLSKKTAVKDLII